MDTCQLYSPYRAAYSVPSSRIRQNVGTNLILKWLLRFVFFPLFIRRVRARFLFPSFSTVVLFTRSVVGGRGDLRPGSGRRIFPRRRARETFRPSPTTPHACDRDVGFPRAINHSPRPEILSSPAAVVLRTRRPPLFGVRVSPSIVLQIGPGEVVNASESPRRRTRRNGSSAVWFNRFRRRNSSSAIRRQHPPSVRFDRGLGETRVVSASRRSRESGRDVKRLRTNRQHTQCRNT